jgi:hypothetical protein
MQNLYDLLGVRPDDDAETLKKAFRGAAKATHPDHHGDDPQAAARFRRISEAYEILRDAEQRAAYDRLLEFKRRPLRHKVKRSWAGMKRHVVQDLMAAVLLAAVLAAGYELFIRAPEMPGHTAAVVTTARESRQAAADHPAEPITVGRDRPERVSVPQMPIALLTAPVAASAANDHDRPEMTNGEPASNPAGQTIALARDSEKDVPTGAGVPAKAEDQPSIGHDASTPDASFSAAEEHNDVPAADDRRDGKTPEPASANPDGVKPPKINMSARAAAAKRHTPSRPALPHVEQATLENRNTPPERDEAPSRVFGVGF